jgi:hypothetical protein
MARSRAGIDRYLVEVYWPGLTEAGMAETAGRARREAGALTRRGGEVSVVSTLLVPEDEFAFCLFEAASATAVEEVCRRAELPFDRILRVIQVLAREQGESE